MFHDWPRTISDFIKQRVPAGKTREWGAESVAYYLPHPDNRDPGLAAYVRELPSDRYGAALTSTPDAPVKDIDHFLYAERTASTEGEIRNDVEYLLQNADAIKLDSRGRFLKNIQTASELIGSRFQTDECPIRIVGYGYGDTPDYVTVDVEWPAGSGDVETVLLEEVQTKLDSEWVNPSRPVSTPR